MKKLISFALGAALAVTASAQSWQDALLYTENEYGGTARSVAMGNALTAVGGDLGSIGLNPAGSAVAGYSQFTITPGLSISVSDASSVQPELAYGDKVHSLFTRMKMPNIGLMLGMDTGRRTGLKRISFGFVSNSTADFTSRMYAAGVNASNSYCGSLASWAQGYPEDALSGSSPYTWWNLDDYSASYGLPWADVVGYRSGIFGTVNGRYLGLTDWNKDGKNTGVLAPLYQKFGFQTKGFKHDMMLNIGFNFSDTFYLGANLGLVRLAYGQSEYWSEAPNRDAEFPAIPFDENPNARFQSLEMKRIFEAEGAGAYLKVGALWRLGGFRMGAAIQTPTVMNLETRMAYFGKASVDGVKLPTSTSPEWEDFYTLISPWRFNFGLALTIGQLGLLSADYELADYGKSRFRSRSDSGVFYGSSYFDDVNADIRDVLGVSHMLRIGTEWNVAPGLALRAGYGFTTSPEHNYLEWVYDPADKKDHLMVFPLSAQERAALCKHYVSVGAGYASGHFFADAAVRYKNSFKQYFTPYEYADYTTDYTDKFSVNGLDPKEFPQYESYQVPELEVVYRRFEVLLTLGWRF